MEMLSFLFSWKLFWSEKQLINKIFRVLSAYMYKFILIFAS